MVFGCRNACGVVDKIDIVEVDDIFGYDKLVAAEEAMLQKGMNYRVGKDYSVFFVPLLESWNDQSCLENESTYTVKRSRDRLRVNR